MAIKKTLGRQRIEIKKLDKKSNKQVTFSKRRAGLFKKAGELSVLCGAEVAVIVFSPNDKVFCFAHPTVEAVLDRFASGSSSPLEPAETYVTVADFNREYNEMLKVLEMEKKKLMEIKELVKNARSSGQFWWDENVEGMGMEDLKQYRAALTELRRKVGERVQRMMVMRVGGDMLPPLPPSAMHIPGSLSGMESGIGDESGDVGGVGGGEGGVHGLGFGYF